MESPNKASPSGGDDSPSPSPSPRTPSRLGRVGSLRAHRNDLSQRLSLLRMTTPSSARKRSKSNPQAWPPPPTPRYSFLNTPSHRRGLPAWDRAFDAVYHSNNGQAPAAAAFSSTLSNFFEDHERERPTSGYFRLPDNVRHRICKLLLPAVDRPVRLNRSCFNRDVWRGGDLVSPADALLPLASYLGVSFAFRADVLVAFLQSEGVTLHAVFSPFVGCRINPLATTWLNSYGPYARSIAIEVDMSHLGCGPEPGATGLLAGVEHVEDLVYEFANAQLYRKESLPLQNLILLCRRFHGRRESWSNRPGTGHSSGGSSFEDVRFQSPEMYASMDELIKRMNDKAVSSPIPASMPSSIPSSPLPPTEHYCPDSYLHLCNHLIHLKGRVNSLRMCGFEETYTSRFIMTLFPDTNSGQAYRVAPSTIWPRLAGQKSCLDAGDGDITIDEHHIQSTFNTPMALRPWEGCVQLPPPALDERGNPILPPIVGDLQRLRSPYLRTTTSLSERACDQMLKDGKGSDKTGLLRLLEKYGKGKKKKKQRALTREAAATM